MMTNLRIARFFVLIVLMLILAVGQASAFCVYNHTNKTLRVRGESCIGCFDVKIKPGGHKCCPGDKRGCE